jgi:hypothetical protein
MSSCGTRCIVVRIVPILVALSLLYVPILMALLSLLYMYPPQSSYLDNNVVEISAFKYGTDTEYIPLHTCKYNNTNNTVITFEGVEGINEIGAYGFNGNLLCEKIDKARSDAQDDNLPITVNITFSCMTLFHYSGIGTGNFLVVIYGMRLAAHVYGNIDLFISCDDAEETKNDLIIPWVTGWFPARPVGRISTIPLTSKEACRDFGNLPIGFLQNEIQHDLRRMAIALMGVPSASHPSAIFAKKYLRSYDTSSPNFAKKYLRLYDTSSPIVTSAIGSCPTLLVPKPNIPSIPSKYVVDDAVLHFRCGDLMDSDNPYYSFMTFHGYTRHISPYAKSIGILTQPFEGKTQSRKEDSSQIMLDRCRIVVTSLMEFIKSQYPNARVNLHNNGRETIALTYARMIMANQTIGGISTFSFLPLISTFGTGYMHAQSDSHPWYPPRPRMHDTNSNDNLILFQDSKLIKVVNIQSLWQTKGKDGVLDWFWNGTME